MSVVTRADEELESARDHIKAATSNLVEILIKDCWGADDFNQDFKDTMHEALITLVKLKRQLSGGE